MKTLTVKQPWATFIVSGVKDVENRTWKTSYRGRVLIHASAKPAFHNLTMNLTHAQMDAIVKTDFPLDARDEFYTDSAIIGEVDIVDCVLNHPSIWAEPTDEFLLALDVVKPTYNWVLENPRFYEEPILNVKGALSLWDFKLGNHVK